jgi:protein SCO1/2
MTLRLSSSALLLGTLLLFPVAAAAENAPGSVPAPALPDVTVLTESGRKAQFADLIRNRTVAINFIFTSCPTVCPLMGANFGRVQKLLGDRDVSLISVSIDPATDTPERLVEWSKRFGAGPGWTLVTGSTLDINRVLKAFGIYTSDPSSHSPSVFIADSKRGIWRRVDGLASPSTILRVIDDVSSRPTP